MTKCGLFRDALSISNAYFTYGGEVAGSVGAEIDGETLKTALSAENGFRIGETPAAPYGLTEAQSDAVYPYPALGGTHYNDYLVLERPAPEEPETEQAEITAELAFGDMITEELAISGSIAYVEAYRDFGLWNDPEALRVALDAAQFASAWGEAGRAALKIKGASETTLEQNLNALAFNGFALKKVVCQNPEETQGVSFTLSYVRDPQNDEMSPEQTAEGVEP